MPIVGDVLAERYRIDGVLGAGGMASVYRATDLRLERQVAVKVLLPNLARDPSLAGRFDREARMLAAVAHPSVAAIFDVEPGDAETGREPFYVMELCDGGSLADRIEAIGALDPEELVPIIEAIAAGLAELHRHGIIHRDVKPGNILFAGGSPIEGGRPKLADFGLAKSDGTAEATTLTAPGTMVGTLPYLAPELLGGDAPTTASDVYALGATTFHALTGRLPKPFDSLARFSDARATPAPLVSSVMPGVGTAFDRPVAAALAIDPTARRSPDDLSTDLTAALERHRAEPVSGEAAVPAGTPSGPDLEDTVVTAAVAAPTAAPTLIVPADPARPKRPARPAPRMALGRSTALTLVVAIVLLVLALIALASSGAFGGPSLPSASQGPSPSPSPSPSPLASANPSPAARALQALDAVFTAIDQARGGKDGLGGGEAHDLETLATSVGQALRAGDFRTAAQAATTLGDRADKVTEKIDPARRTGLLNAIRDLQAAIPSG